MQPCQGIAWWAHRDDDRQRGSQFLALLSNLIGLKDPDALKIPARRAEYSLTESASSPVQAEPRHLPQLGHLGAVWISFSWSCSLFALCCLYSCTSIDGLR